MRVFQIVYERERERERERELCSSVSEKESEKMCITERESVLLSERVEGDAIDIARSS